MNRPKKLKKLKAKQPFVSICTPTFNRRPFISSMIECFQKQDYPKNKMEWLIMDDGTDKIGDLVKDIPQVRYFSYDEQMVLGKKRNLLNKKAKGDTTNAKRIASRVRNVESKRGRIRLEKKFDFFMMIIFCFSKRVAPAFIANEWIEP